MEGRATANGVIQREGRVESTLPKKKPATGARGRQTMPAYGGGRAAGGSDGFLRAGPALGGCSGRLGTRA